MGQKNNTLKPQPSNENIKNEQIQIQVPFDQTKEKLYQIQQLIMKNKNPETLFVSSWGYLFDKDFGIQVGQLISQQIQLINLKIDLSINNLQSEGVIGLFKNFENLDKLQILVINLQENKLTNEGLKGIIKGISKCYQLRHLQINLSDNKITGKDISFQHLENLLNITRLNLNFQNNRIEKDELEVLSKEFRFFPNLKILNLNFRDNRLKSIINLDFISQLQHLEALNIKLEKIFINTEIFNKWQSTFKNGFCSLKSLELDLGSTSIKDSKQKLLFAGIGQIKTLKSLSLNLDHLNLDIFIEISQLQNINNLSIYNSEYQSDISSACFKTLAKMQNLRIFQLIFKFRNSYTQVIRSLIQHLYKAKRLVVIYENKDLAF